MTMEFEEFGMANGILNISNSDATYGFALHFVIWSYIILSHINIVLVFLC